MSQALTINRRTALRMTAAAATIPLSAAPSTLPSALAAADAQNKTAVGLVVYCCQIRRQAMRRDVPGLDLHQPLRFLKHVRRLGAGGMQCPLGILAPDEARQLRGFAESHDLFVEAIISPPKNENDLERFEAQMKTAVTAGAAAARTVIIPGRRYEYFDSLKKFTEFDARGRRSMELAAPIAEKHRLPLAIENHKDHRNHERVALLEHIDSEFVGACVDMGNSLALLEDPIETIKAFAPWAHSVHLKDQAVQPYADGFLLADVPLGQGLLDLGAMVQILQEKRPNVRFSLELITRDPLKVPVLTGAYWATFPDVLASDLARTLRYVRDGAADNMQDVTKMSPPEQLAREDANVRESLDYARDRLGL